MRKTKNAEEEHSKFDETEKIQRLYRLEDHKSQLEINKIKHQFPEIEDQENICETRRERKPEPKIPKSTLNYLRN